VTGYANRFDTDGVVFRLHLLAGMLAVVGWPPAPAQRSG